jgi:hypothetical protein
MATFQDKFCRKNSCPKKEFVQRVFWLSLYPHAVIVAPAFMLLHDKYSAYFDLERELISAVGQATDMGIIRERVREYYWDSNNRGWLRRICRIRISGERLKNLARRYFKEDKSIPVCEDTKIPA